MSAPISDPEAESRGFNLPARNRLWRDRVLPRLIVPLFWVYWVLLLPAWFWGLPRLRRRRSRRSTIAIESGIVGWTHVFFEELHASAEEYLGADRVERWVINRDLPYLPQFLALQDEQTLTHLVLDMRTPGQSWRRSLGEALATSWSILARGQVPIVILTDASYRRQRWQAAVLTAFRGIVVTFAEDAIVRRMFPHGRLIGPMVMPVSIARLELLEARSEDRVKEGRAVKFIGSIYPPRSDFLDCLRERLEARDITLTVNGDKRETTSDQYWEALADADVIVTTTLQGPDRSFVDWGWVQQLVFRFIETMAAGTALVAAEAPGVQRFFEPGVDFLQFRSVDDAALAVSTLISDPARRFAIAAAGHAKAADLIRRHAFWTLIDEALDDLAMRA